MGLSLFKEVFLFPSPGILLLLPEVRIGGQLQPFSSENTHLPMVSLGEFLCAMEVFF